MSNTSKKIILVINKNFPSYLQIFFLSNFHKHVLSYGDFNDYKIIYDDDEKYLEENNNQHKIIISAYGIPNPLINNKYENFDTNIHLDDKILYYNFIKEKIKKTYGLKLIPTFNDTPKINFKEKFVVKHKNACSSNDLIIINDYILNILPKYDPKDYQIQKFIDFDYLYGVDCSCINGKIIGVYSYTKKNGVNKKDYILGFDHIIKNYIKYESIEKFITKIVNKVKYNGFVEFEFLIKNNDIYILECNPRMSGAISDSKYYEILIKPYLNSLLGIKKLEKKNKKVSEKRHIDNKFLRISKLLISLIFLNLKKTITG